MSTVLAQPIVSVGEFLVHALELEVISAERYRELADSMSIHNNPEVAALFRELAEAGDQHVNEVRQRAAGFTLPEISPWEFKWTCPDSPEAACIDDAHYLMTKCQALQLALHVERRGRDFYREVAAASADPVVKGLALEMAEEESEHVVMIKQWYQREACERELSLEDLDPPNIPE